MTGPAAGVVPREEAFGFAQRRSLVFSAWWYPAVLAVSGAVYAGLALALGQSAETGVVMAILGVVGSALGWAFTAWPRFTRKLVVWPLGLAAGLACTRRLMMNSAGSYAKWLERR